MTTARASQTNPAEDVYAFGDAPFSGSTGHVHLARPIVGMARTATGHGYYEVATDGGIFAYGDARFFGSTGAMHLNQPIVGMAVTPSGTATGSSRATAGSSRSVTRPSSARPARSI